MALFCTYLAWSKADWPRRALMPFLCIGFVAAFVYIAIATGERIERPWPAMRERATILAVVPLHETLMNADGQTVDRVETIVVMRCTHGIILLDKESARERGDALREGDRTDILHAPVTRVRTWHGAETGRTTEGMQVVRLAGIAGS